MDASCLVDLSPSGTFLQHTQTVFVRQAILYSMTVTLQLHNQAFQVFRRIALFQFPHLKRAQPSDHYYAYCEHVF